MVKDIKIGSYLKKSTADKTNFTLTFDRPPAYI